MAREIKLLESIMSRRTYYIHGAIGGASGAARGVQCGGRDGETVREVRRRSRRSLYNEELPPSI
jgi:hypothetical protein